MLALLAGCGGGGNSDEENVEQVVRDFAEATRESDGDRFCKEIITREFLEKTTGAKGDRAEEQCAKQIDALKGADIEIVDIKSTKVNGDKATVTAELKQQGQTGQQTFNLQREDGDFRLTSSTPYAAPGRVPSRHEQRGPQAGLEHRGRRQRRGAPGRLSPICDEVVERHRAGDAVVVVTSGAIARGMRLMELTSRPAVMEELQAASAIGQGRLYRAYDELMAERGVHSAQVLLTFFDMSARTHYVNARRTLRKLLDWRVVPVINENDTTTTDDISFGDNDLLAAQVAILLGADRLVMLTDTDGVYSADPALDPGAVLIPDVRDFQALEEVEIGFSASPLGSGGMRSKVLAAEMATAAGIPATIARGTDRGAVRAALAGEDAGTRFHPQAARVSSFKLWLRYAKPSHGSLTVDAGAERALRDRGTSLLPVGIVAVAGDFSAGDAVEVRAAEGNGRPIGKGIVNYSAAELRRIQGMKSDAVRELLPRAAEEAVHRDYFVLE